VLTKPVTFASGQSFTGSLSVSGGGAVSGSAGAISLAAGGTDQGITLTPSGAGVVTVAAPLVASGAISTSDPTDSTSTSTGALIVNGGAAVVKKTTLGDDLLLVPTSSTNATVRVSGTTVANTPGIWFSDGGSPTAANAALSGNATNTAVNAPTSGSLNLRLGNTNYVTVTPTSATLANVPLAVTATTASSSTTTGSATFGGGIGVNGRTSTKTLAVGGGAGVDFISTMIATLDFPSIAANGGVQDLTVNLPGASLADSVTVVEATGTFMPAGIIVRGIVTATNTITVRATNTSGAAIDPGSTIFRVTVISF